MTHSKDRIANDKIGTTSRRRVLKAAAAVTAGLAAPTFLRIGSALAAYPDRPVPYAKNLEKALLPDKGKVVAAAREVLGF